MFVAGVATLSRQALSINMVWHTSARHALLVVVGTRQVAKAWIATFHSQVPHFLQTGGQIYRLNDGGAFLQLALHAVHGFRDSGMLLQMQCKALSLVHAAAGD